jgi:nucleotide-binding universal stress UspA family protein
MLNIKKILLPVDFPNTSLRVIHEAAALAHHFHSEIVMLHVTTAQSHAAGVPEAGPELAEWDMVAQIIREAEKSPYQCLGPELHDLTVQRVLAEGDVAQAIMQTAQDDQIDLIMMPSHGQMFSQFLLGSVTAKVLNGTDSPIWTDAHVDESQMQKFAIRSILCAIDFDSRNHATLSWAAGMAAEFGARLTLAHVTAGVELWGPGGDYVDERWKEELVSDASEHIAKLQQDLGTKAEVFIGSGDVPKVLSRAVEQTNADLLVSGSRPYGEHLRTHGYAIICAVPIPVLSV